MSSPLGDAVTAAVLAQEQNAEQVQLQAASHGWYWREDMERKLAAMEQNPEHYTLGTAGDVLWYKRGKEAAAALGRDVDRPKPGASVGPGGPAGPPNGQEGQDDQAKDDDAPSSGRRRRQRGRSETGASGTGASGRGAA